MTFRTNFLLFVFYWLAPNLSFGQELLQDSLSVDITAPSEKISVASISRHEFRTMSASFDDPSRLLTKYAGFANSNDQSNDIVYEGLAPHMTKWSLFGAEILNPNHLSNAGTLADTPSRSSGGVNAFSGQVLGDFSYLGHPNPSSFNALAGMANMSLRSPYKNKTRVQLSLIGLEAGIDQALNKSMTHWLQGNYRYSTIGLLSQLGVDLGDEDIRYQDINLNYTFRPSKDFKLVAYANYGKSSNQKDTVDQFGEIILRKDYFEVDYLSNNFIGGLHTDFRFNSFDVKSTINYSKRDDSYLANKTKTGDASMLFAPHYTENLKEDLISLNTSIEKNNTHQTYGIGSIYLWNFYNVNVNPEDLYHPYIYNVSHKYNYQSFVPYLFYTQNLFSKISIGTNLKAQYTNRLNTWNEERFGDWMFLPSAHLSIQTSNKSNLRFEYSKSTQVASPQILASRQSSDFLPIQPEASTAQHYSINFKYKAKQQIGLKLYYHQLDDLIVLDRSILASGLNGTSPLLGERTTEGNNAHVFGVSLSEKTNLFGHQFRGNINLFDGSQELNKVEHKLNRYEYNFMASISISRTIELNQKRSLGYHISYITRGGQYEPEIDVLKPLGHDSDYLSVRLKPYHRVDLRIYLDTKKSKYKHRLSLDIQNVLNRKNDGFQAINYADYSTIIRKQLGIIPVLSWSVEI